MPVAFDGAGTLDAALAFDEPGCPSMWQRRFDEAALEFEQEASCGHMNGLVGERWANLA